MRLIKILLTFAIVTTVHSFVFAQVNDPSILNLERIYSSNEFAQERFGPAKWLEDGSGYTTLEESQSERGMDIIKYDPGSGTREVLVSASRLIPSGSGSPLQLYDYSWSPDSENLLIFTNTRRVWRDNTRGDYWVLNLSSGKLHQLGGDSPEATLMFATFSPNNDHVGYVRQNNVYVEDWRSGNITQLTHDGSRTIINGTFDWVYEEELSLQNGFRWSPDSRSIAYWQLDAEGVGEYLMLNTTDDIYSYTIPVQYPKVGTTNSSSRVGVVNITGGQTTWMKVPGDPRNNYIARMEWAARSDEVLMQHLNRLQNRLDLLIGNSQTGNVESILVEQDDAWINMHNDLKWMNGGEQFTWVSEKDGWRHVYIVSRTGDDMELITPGKFDVVSIQNIDEKNGWLYYIASPDNPTQRYLYRSRLNGRGDPERLSPEDQPGTHSYQMSGKSDWSFHTFSSFDEPPVIELVSLPDHNVKRTFVDNAQLKSTVSALKDQPVEFFRIDIGIGVELDAWMIKPYNFNPDMKYPLFFYVYGEPAGQTVLDRWGGSRYLWHQMLAQNGYIVISVDNRGTPAPRGREWRKSVYRKIGIIASQDQAAAARSIIARWDYIDEDRVGIWGWSGGGSMTLNMMFRHPEIYHTGMSVAPVTNQRYYDTIYQERYMGLPDDNVEGFRDGSPITFAQHLEGNLLLVHGSGDDNVHYQNSEALINKLIENNKKFTMMSYPNRSHGIFEGRNTTRHLFELLTDYLLTNLPSGPVPK